MRPIKLGPFSPVTALTTAFNAQTFNSTGAATAVTTPATTDLLAHQVTLTSPVQATLAGVTFTIVGTDSDGNAKTETGITGPASNATVTSTGYFKTITTIQPSATMGALVVSVGIAAPSLTQTLPLEWRSIVAATHDVDVSGTINFTLQESFENVYNARPETLDWGSYSSAFTGKTATVAAAGMVGANAARLLFNSVTNGAAVTWRVIQPTQITG
jgi:hypothetical protein